MFTQGVFAQQEKAASSADKQPAIEKIDYHSLGSIMPELKLVTVETISKQFSGRALKKVNKKNRKEFHGTPFAKFCHKNKK